MNTAGSLAPAPEKPLPLWLLAEVTYRCPLQCPYCSNPVNFAKFLRKELSTKDWIRVFEEARELGAAQLGFSGGEPLLRRDLEILIKEAHRLGFYTNLITSSVGMEESRLEAIKQAGLDSIQISIQDSSKTPSDYLAGSAAFEHKVRLAKLCKKHGFPLTLNFVIHRHNIERTKDILELCVALEANHVELANTQYYGFALKNRNQLLPSKDQLVKAEAITKQYQDKYKGQMNIFFVVPDYYENRPKPCMSGWGRIFMNISPEGTVLPCHSARVIPGLDFPNVTEHSLRWIWYESAAFNQFRGFDWMKEPCKSCPLQSKDYGGCRCQAYLLTGDAKNTDPSCDLAPDHQVVVDAIQQAGKASHSDQSMIFRTSKNSRMFIGD